MTAREFIEEYVDYLDKDKVMFIRLASFIAVDDRKEFLEIIRILDSVGIDTKDARIEVIETGIQELLKEAKKIFTDGDFNDFDEYVQSNLKFPLGLTEDDVAKIVHRVYYNRT